MLIIIWVQRIEPKTIAPSFNIVIKMITQVFASLLIIISDGTELSGVIRDCKVPSELILHQCHNNSLFHCVVSSLRRHTSSALFCKICHTTITCYLLFLQCVHTKEIRFSVNSFNPKCSINTINYLVPNGMRSVLLIPDIKTEVLEVGRIFLHQIHVRQGRRKGLWMSALWNKVYLHSLILCPGTQTFG